MKFLGKAVKKLVQNLVEKFVQNIYTYFHNALVLPRDPDFQAFSTLTPESITIWRCKSLCKDTLESSNNVDTGFLYILIFRSTDQEAVRFWFGFTQRPGKFLKFISAHMSINLSRKFLYWTFPTWSLPRFLTVHIMGGPHEGSPDSTPNLACNFASSFAFNFPLKLLFSGKGLLHLILVLSFL